MQHRFNFRAWNKEDKKMYAVEGVYAYKDECTQGGEVFLQWHKTSHYFPEQVELMQCTGLKDKNGILIYEHDILKTLYTKPNGEVINRNCVVEFNRCAFWINYGIGASYLDNDDCIYEVIGNIYENKDLLND